MALSIQTAVAGTNFTGTLGNGQVFFGVNTNNDTQRVEILGVSVQSIGDTKTLIRILLAPSIIDVTQGYYYELASLADVTGLTQACCRCIVPAGWSLLCITTGPSASDCQLMVDWHNVTLEPRA